MVYSCLFNELHIVITPSHVFQEEVLEESQMMIPDAEQRWERAHADLSTLMEDIKGRDDIPAGFYDCSEWKAAEEALAFDPAA